MHKPGMFQTYTGTPKLEITWCPASETSRMFCKTITMNESDHYQTFNRGNKTVKTNKTTVKPKGSKNPITPLKGEESTSLDTTPTVSKNTGTHTKKNLRSSELPKTRLLQGYLRYRRPDGKMATGRVALDTQSNMSFSLPSVSLNREKRHWESDVVYGAGNKPINVGDPLSFTVFRNGHAVAIDTHEGPRGLLKDGVCALLSCHHIAMLGIDLNLAQASMEHKELKFLTAKTKAKRLTEEVRDRVSLMIDIKNKVSRKVNMTNLTELAQCMSIEATCLLTDSTIAQYLELHPDEFKSKPISKEDLVSGPITADEHALFVASCSKYNKVFATNSNTLPPVMKDIPPHLFKLKEGAVSIYCPRPNFSPSKAKLLDAWLDWALEDRGNGALVEPAPKTSWASRLILCPKYNPETPKDQPPDGIRVAWAGVQVNERLHKTVPTYP